MWGESIFPLPGGALSGIRGATTSVANPLYDTLFSLLIVILVTRAMGAVVQKFGQPRVIGEVIGGILLGPSLLGTFAPQAASAVLPPAAAPFLSVISQVGVLLFMFLIGLELDLKQLSRSGKAALLISHASIVVPFLSGLGLAFFLYGSYAPLGIPFSSFGLFVGVSMSITAFPVLARILAETGLSKKPLGMLALTCAAVDDVTAWCLLAVVVGLLQSSLKAAAVTITLTVLYTLFMIFAIRPLMTKLVATIDKDSGKISEGALVFIFMCLLFSAGTTEFIGVHALFGGFLLGVVIPHESRVAHSLNHRLNDLVRVFFLPAFFALTGLRTQIGLLNSLADWQVCAAVIAVATVGKFGGAFVAARISGMTYRESSIIGALMNTRGLVELIVLNIGLDLGVLSPRLFTILVVMALVTTMMTGPLLALANVRPSPRDL